MPIVKDLFKEPLGFNLNSYNPTKEVSKNGKVNSNDCVEVSVDVVVWHNAVHVDGIGNEVVDDKVINVIGAVVLKAEEATLVTSFLENHINDHAIR